MLNLRYYLVLPCLLAILAGCTTPGKKPATPTKPGAVKPGAKPAAAKPESEGTPYVVVLDFTPFYSLGPAQPSGPDLSLRNGELLLLLKREWGYSRVRLNDDRTGYVSNDSIAPAPPQPKPLPEQTSQSGKRRGRGSERYTGEQVNDSPLPDLPPPNLNIAPEDTPDLAPPTSQPSPAKPGFRY
ncbi:MAG: hypothetical protein ABI615_01625 [Chthoniobacterales bacterium]